MAAASALAAPKLPRGSYRCGWPPVASWSLRMMRTAVFSTALIFGGLRRLLRRFGAVLFGIGAIREEAQRGLVPPRRDAIGRPPDLPITNDGPVEYRLLGLSAEVAPHSDAARWRLVLGP